MLNALSTHPFYLRLFETHPFSDKFRWLGQRPAMLALPIASLALLILAAAIDHNVTQPHLIDLWCTDVGQYLDTKSVPCGQMRLSSEMSAFRDTPTLVVVALLPLTIPLMYQQWSGLSTFLPQMEQRQLLAISDRAALESEVAACNNYFRRWGQASPVVSVAAAISTYLVVQSQVHSRSFHFLKTPDGTGIQPTSWWVSASGSTMASTVFFVVGMICVNVILLQTIHGSRVVWLLWRIRANVTYGADPTNSDGSYGWSEVKDALFATWTLIIIHGLCIGALLLALPEGGILYLMPLMAQWIIVTPVYLILPVWLTRRNIRRWKRHTIARLRAEIAASPSRAEKLTLSAELDITERVNVNPYAGVVARTFHYLGVIGTIVFVYQIAVAIYS